MSTTEARPTHIDAEDPATIPEVAVYLRSDTNPAPDILLERTTPERGVEPVSADSFTSPETFQLEHDRLWSKVWQLACWGGDIPNPGDFIEYSIGDESIIVARQNDGTVASFHNVCQHRGARLIEGSGCAQQFRCSFHAWSWNLDGSLDETPCAWDFPQVAKETHGLPSVRTEVWNELVFVSFDESAVPFEEFLGETILRHFERWPFQNRHKAMHIVMDVNANWKVALEAFLELYHTAGTHPQASSFSSGILTQYDHYGPHARMVGLQAVTDPRLKGVEFSEQEIYDLHMGEIIMADVGSGDSEAEGRSIGDHTAREAVADHNRTTLSARTGKDYSSYSDTEFCDVLQYFVFPNSLVWGGLALPIVHRFLPGVDQDHCTFETMILQDSADGERPPSGDIIHVRLGERLADTMGMAGALFDQDVANMAKVQKGLKSRSFSKVSFAQEQEGNIRAFHASLAEYLETPQ